MTLDKPGDKPVFHIPTWCPGWYVVTQYQDSISGVQAVQKSGDPLELKQVDSRTWEVANPLRGAVTLNYTVMGDDPGLGFFGVKVLPHTAFVNGPAAFMWADGHKDERMRLTIKNPEGWATATSMDEDKSGDWMTRDYDHLLDCPIRLGKFEKRSFEVQGVPFDAVFTTLDGTYRTDFDDATRQLKAVATSTMAMFPSRGFKHYIFHLNLAVGNFSGGLEHQSSTVLAIFPSQKLNLDTLAAHEFFHAWCVKQIRPKTLGPFDYTKAVRTKEMWLCEGVTDYYGNLNPYRANLYDSSRLLRSYTGQIRQLQSGRTRLTKTVEDASLEAWEGGSQGTGDLSYYNKGFLIGLLFDAAIRDATQGRKSMDDVMRLLYERYHMPKPGFDEDGILKAINDVAGKDLTALYNKMVRSTNEMPYEVLEGIGLRVRLPGKPIMDVGFAVAGSIVTQVDERNAAKLKEGDEILSDFSVSLDTPKFVLKIKRGDSTLDVPMELLQTEPTRISLEINPFASKDQRDRLAEYLKR